MSEGTQRTRISPNACYLLVLYCTSRAYHLNLRARHFGRWIRLQLSTLGSHRNARSLPALLLTVRKLFLLTRYGITETWARDQCLDPVPNLAALVFYPGTFAGDIP